MEKFSQPFEGSNTEPGKVAVAFYAGIFSYSGWLVYLKKNINNNTKLVNELLCGSVSFVGCSRGSSTEFCQCKTFTDETDTHNGIHPKCGKHILLKNIS